MAKLTRKEKRKLRARVRRWAGIQIRNNEFPVTLFPDLEGDQNALDYINEFKGQLADGMMVEDANEADVTES